MYCNIFKAKKNDIVFDNPQFAERFAKAASEWLYSLIDDAGITEEEWKEANEGYDAEMGERFHKDILTILGSIIDESGITAKDLTPNHRLGDHFEANCLAKDHSKCSSPEKIFYDFKDNSQYVEYDRKISKLIEKSDNMIGSLFDYEGILPALEKVFEGDSAVMFCNSCGLYKDKHIIGLSLISSSDGAVRNYKSGKTINVCIKNCKGETLVLYPVDAGILKNKFRLLTEEYKGK